MYGKKKILCVILLIFTVCVCVACTETPAVTDPSATETANPYYTFKGVKAGDSWNEALAVFGSYENCIQEDDIYTTYTYPHFMVTTVKQGNQEDVMSIRLRSSAVETEDGSAIGDSKETVIKCEGKTYTLDSYGGLVYVKEHTTLTFTLDEDGTVYAITYGSIDKE